MSDGAVAFEFELDASPEKVWRALTVPALLERWLLPENGAAAALDAKVETTLLEADPPRSLSWRWREAGQDDDLVSVTLTPNEAGGTALKLVHMRRAFALPAPANGNSVMMMRRAA